MLREHRGDGHFAALLAAGIDGCEALVLRCALDMKREVVQPIRGWTDEQWDAAQARLADRGLIGPDGELAPAGRDAHAAVEAATDRAAARPWDRLGAAATKELAGVLTPVAQSCAAAIPYPTPIGVPAPRGGSASHGGGPGVVPVGQQRAQGGDERDRLVEHDVVTRGGDLDERGDAAEPVVHDLAHLPGQDAVLGTEQGHAAVQAGEQGEAELLPAEDPRVELPGPAALGGPHRRLGHMSGDVGQRRLRGHRAEPRDGRLAGGVDVQRPEGAVLPGGLLLRGKVAHGESMTTAPVIWDPYRLASRSVTKPPMLCPIIVGGPAIPASAATASTSRAHTSRL